MEVVAFEWLCVSLCQCTLVPSACVCVCVFQCGDRCPQHLSGNLALSRALPMRAGKHEVMDLTLHTSAKHNVNVFPSLYSPSCSSSPLPPRPLYSAFCCLVCWKPMWGFSLFCCYLTSTYLPPACFTDGLYCRSTLDMSLISNEGI